MPDISLKRDEQVIDDDLTAEDLDIDTAEEPIDNEEFENIDNETGSEESKSFGNVRPSQTEEETTTSSAFANLNLPKMQPLLKPVSEETLGLADIIINTIARARKLDAEETAAYRSQMINSAKFLFRLFAVDDIFQSAEFIKRIPAMARVAIALAILVVLGIIIAPKHVEKPKIETTNTVQPQSPSKPAEAKA